MKLDLIGAGNRSKTIEGYENVLKQECASHGVDVDERFDFPIQTPSQDLDKLNRNAHGSSS
jgi:hypothetical protein